MNWSLSLWCSRNFLLQTLPIDKVRHNEKAVLKKLGGRFSDIPTYQKHTGSIAFPVYGIPINGGYCFLNTPNVN